MLYAANVIANPKLHHRHGNASTPSAITPDLIKSLHEAGGIEANVSVGYHAIEFLLWGQDLNGTGPGAGNRPYTDFDPGNCTNGNCDRRAAYLKAATDLLVADLRRWLQLGGRGRGPQGRDCSKPEAEALAAILTGLGSLSYGELAGERMKLGLMLHDPEEEHDCFSDNTHNSALLRCGRHVVDLLRQRAAARRHGARRPRDPGLCGVGCTRGTRPGWMA